MGTQVLTSTSFIGTDIALNRKAIFKNRKQENVSGKETAIALRVIPRWQWEITFNFARSTYQANSTEFASLTSFFNSLSGGFDSWLWQDPEDNTETLGQAILISTANPGTYQLSRTLGNFGTFAENIYAPNVVSQVFLVGSSLSSGSTVGVTVGSWGSSIPGQITISTFSPSTSVIPFVNFSYYWPVRWDQDEMQFERFGSGWWAVKKMTFTSLI